MYLPTRDECQGIINRSEAFYCTSTVVEGYNVEMYDYRLASITDFVNNNAFELRGLTFVQQPDGTWVRNLLMNKFFNINQTDGWMYDDVNNKKVVRVQDKLDGSVISFIKFPNGVIRAKSKMSFTSDQAKMAQEIYNTDSHIRAFVDLKLSAGIMPIFELVSPDNQIVLEYPTTKLVLLQVRNPNGTYYTKRQVTDKVKAWHPEITIAADFAHEISDIGNHKDTVSVLDKLLERKLVEEGIEGWIVTFEDGQMAKIKTNWYLQLHGLIGPDAFRENLLVKTIMDGNIDDVISNLVPGVKKDKLVTISEKVEHHFNHLVTEFKRLRGEYFNKYNENRKEFAIQYSQSHELFSDVMKTLYTSCKDVEKTAEQAVKDHILRKTSSLNSAKEWIAQL